MITLAEARRDTRAFLGEPVALRFSDTLINLLLDLVQEHVAGLTLAYQRTVTLTEADGVLITGLRDYVVEGDIGPGVLGIDDDFMILQAFWEGLELAKIAPTMLST